MARNLARHRHDSELHFAAGRGTGGAGTRSSNERTGAPARNLPGRVPRTNGIHTASGDGPAGSPLHGSTRAKRDVGRHREVAHLRAAGGPSA